jgi:predicted Zn-dependent peptidase
MINRSIPPALNPIKEAHLIKPEKIILANGLPLYIINAGTQDLCKIEIIYNAGSVYQQKALTALATNSLMREGTKNYTTEQISEIFDFYGAYFESNTDRFTASFSLYTLNKNLQHVFPVFADIQLNPIFPQKEFELFKENQLQKFKINQQKVEVIARTHFPTILFGPNHRYGKQIKEQDYQLLTLNDIYQFYADNYLNKISYIVLSGKINSQHIELIKKYFESFTLEKNALDTSYWVASPSNKQSVFIEKSDAIQSAIRIGRPLFSKNHPDYFGFQVLNTVLGGYFGSRLMTNIREEKGYTYGIGSGILPLPKGGMFFISTEVGKTVTENAITEIYKEIKQLREKLIPEEELNIVKNYMLGTFLKSVEGPFAQAEKFKAIYDFNLTYEYYKNYLNTVKNISSKELIKLANKYLQESDLFQLVVGSRN